MEEVKKRREEVAIQNEKHKILKTSLSLEEQRGVTARTNKRKKELILAGRTEL